MSRGEGGFAGGLRGTAGVTAEYARKILPVSAQHVLYALNILKPVSFACI